MFRNNREVWRECYGHKFPWTSEHYNAEELQPLIHTYDVLGSEVLDRLDEISPPPPASKKPFEPPAPGEVANTSGRARRDLYQILVENKDKDELLQKFWKSVTDIPDWVDWDQIERGQKVFYRYGGPAVVSVSKLLFRYRPSILLACD